jgi:hypothetical protein
MTWAPETGPIAAAGIAAMPDNPFRHTVLGGALVAPRKIHGHNGSSATECGCQRSQR